MGPMRESALRDQADFVLFECKTFVYYGSAMPAFTLLHTLTGVSVDLLALNPAIDILATAGADGLKLHVCTVLPSACRLGGCTRA
jgi:hypothetical protein